MTQIVVRTREPGEQKNLPTYRGCPEGHGPSSLCDTPFRMTRLAAFIHLLSNVMRAKRFLSRLILTLS